MENKVTYLEFNAICDLTHRLKLDNVFDIYHDDAEDCDYFKDYEEGTTAPLEEGLEWIADSLVYTSTHDGISRENAILVANLLLRYNLIKDKFAEWFIEGGEDEEFDYES